MNPQLINLENIHHYYSNNIESNNSTIYRIGPPVGNNVTLLAVDEDDNKIYRYSNELHIGLNTAIKCV